IQRKIKTAAAHEQNAFDTGKKVAIGVNKYPNKEDVMKSVIERNPFDKKQPRKTLIEPIIEKRLAQTIEKERLDHE
ncbi:MAG: methylmalonyl-CoA mutase family protein, partial [Flavobacteriaceae bacterium]|nr:methylmalonyl-CoA mutase family protein [Flavobacteriaceae bacterium]